MDTDSVSEYLRKNQNVVDKVEQYLRDFGRINLGIITYYEIMNDLKYRDAKNQLSRFEAFASKIM